MDKKVFVSETLTLKTGLDLFYQNAELDFYSKTT